jgi:hypothetical protein
MAVRKKPVRVLQSPLTGHIYALTDYSITGDGENIVARTKHDVTDDVRRLIAEAIDAEQNITCICNEDLINHVGCQCGAETRREFLRQQRRE